MRILLGLLLVACSSTSGTLKARFARERACPENQVRVQEAGGNQYNVSGCEQRTLYVCGTVGGFGDPGASCTEQGQRQASPPETDGHRVPPIDPRIQEPR